MDRYSADVRYGLRQLRLNPMFTLVAVLSLALGIGANTAIFQLVNAIRLRSLPVANPQELAYLDYAPHSRRGGWWSTRSATFTSANWESIRRHQDVFSDVMAWSAYSFNLVAEGKARYAEGLFVSGDFFRVLSAHAAAGRVFTADDDRPGCGAPGAVIGYSFWQSEFGQDPAITSRTVRLDGHVFPIIGVTAPEFFGVEIGHRFEVAVPLEGQLLTETAQTLKQLVIGPPTLSWLGQAIAESDQTANGARKQLKAGKFESVLAAPFDKMAYSNSVSQRRNRELPGSGHDFENWLPTMDSNRRKQRSFPNSPIVEHPDQARRESRDNESENRTGIL